MHACRTSRKQTCGILGRNREAVTFFHILHPISCHTLNPQGGLQRSSSTTNPLLLFSGFRWNRLEPTRGQEPRSLERFEHYRPEADPNQTDGGSRGERSSTVEHVQTREQLSCHQEQRL